MREIEIGDKIRFRPAANYDHSAGFPNELQIEVTGTVEYINREHNYFRVSYPLPGCIGHECFKIDNKGVYHENHENDSNPQS